MEVTQRVALLKGLSALLKFLKVCVLCVNLNQI